MNSGCISFMASAAVLFPLPGSPVIHIAIPSIVTSKIQGALHIFDGFAWNAMGINHCRPHIAMAEQCLDCPYVIICLKEVGGKRVAESMSSNALRELGPPDRFVKRQRELVSQVALELAAPIRVCFERFPGIVPRLDLRRQIVDDLVPIRRS